MDTTFKIGFVGFSNTAKNYKNAIDKFENLSFEGTYFLQEKENAENYTDKQFESYQELLENVDIVFYFGEKIQRKIIADAIRKLKHIFIDDYSCILNENIDFICNLVAEASITAQVSMPKMRYWSVKEIIETYKNISYIYLDKTNDYNRQRTTIDIYPEILAMIKIAESEVVTTHCKKIQLMTRKSELMHVNIEFLNGVSANIKANPCGFYDNEELTIIAEKNMALIDLRKREWHNLVYKTPTAEPIKEFSNMDEIPFIEREEISDLIKSITEKTEPFISVKSIKSLWKCLETMQMN